MSDYDKHPTKKPPAAQTLLLGIRKDGSPCWATWKDITGTRIRGHRRSGKTTFPHEPGIQKRQ
jgi:hypothetical protein